MTSSVRRGRLVALAATVIAATLGVAPGPAQASSVFSAVGPATPTVDAPRSVAFSPSGAFLAAAGAAGPLSRFAFSQGGGLHALAPSSACAGSSVAFKPVGNVLASVDAQSSTVSMCSVSGTDGSITPLGSPLPTGTTPTSVRFSPDGRLLATLDSNAGTVSMFTVGATALAPVNEGEGFFVDFETTSVTFSPDSRLLVVTSGCPIRHTLLVFTVGDDGMLTQTDATDPPLGCAQDVAFDPSGHGLVVLSSDRYSPFAGQLTKYSISADGHLTQAGAPVAAGTAPSGVAYSPDGKLVAYVSDQNDTLSLVRTSSSGELVPVMTLPTGDGPSSVTFSADGTLLAVGTRDDDRVALFRVAPGPVLLPAGAPTELDADANGLAISPSGRIAVSTFDPDGLELYALDGAGRLTPGGTLGPGTVIEPHAVALSPDGQLLAIGSGEGTLSTYLLSGAGAPMPADAATTGNYPIRAAFSPDGSLIATANYYDHSVSLFSVGTKGALTPRTTLPTGDGPISLAFSPDGALLLTADSGSGQLSVFSVSGATLAARPPIVTGGFPQSVAFRPSGGQIAVVDYPNHSLRTFAIAADGSVTFLDQAVVGTPERVAYSPSGGLIAVAGDPGELRVFTVSPAGALARLGDVTAIDAFPTGLAFDPTGRFMLIPQSHDRTLWVYPLAAPTLDTVVSSGPATFDNAPSPAFAFDASYPATYECKVDTGPFGACAAASQIPIAADGPHALSVRARDALGNADPSPTSYSWTSDRAAPSAPSPEAPADGATNLAPVVDVSWGASSDATSGVGGYDLRVDGTSRAAVMPDTCAATCSATLGPLSDGDHTWEVVATDAAGNEVHSATRHFSVDAQPPSGVTIVAPIDGAVIGSARPLLSWGAATDGGSGVAGYDVSVGGTVLRAAATSIELPTPLADGAYTWSVAAIDAVGNRGATASGTFVLDTTPPVARLAVGPRQTRPGIAVTLDAHESSDADGGAIADYSFDTDGDGSFERDTGPSPTTTTVFPAPGSYHVGVRVSDRSGLVSEATFDVTIVPGANIIAAKGAAARFVPAKATASRDVTLVLTPPSGATAVRVSNDEDPDSENIFRKPLDGPKAISIPWTLDRQTSPGKETKLVYVWFERGTDLVHAIPSIVLDEVAPVVTATITRIARPRARARAKRAAASVVKIRARDASGTGVKRIRVTRGKCAGPFRPVGRKVRIENGVVSMDRKLPSGRGAVRVQVRDAVGNRSACRTARSGR